MKLPKFLEVVFGFYPAAHMTLILASLVWFVRSLEPLAFLCLSFSAYLLSPILWKLLQLIFGAKTEGAFAIGRRAPKANLWLLYYQLQGVYAHFDAFERLLKLVPGAYSMWLRFWGSQVGRKVNWTAECQIVDRGHVEIGDRVLIGNRSYFSAHAIKKYKDRYLLYVKRIRVGNDTLVSYATHVGPGVVIGQRSYIESGAGLYPNTVVDDGEKFGYESTARH